VPEPILRPWLYAFDNIYTIAAIWIGLAFMASLISIRVGLSAALVEFPVGVAGGNLFQLSTTAWIDFLASFGSVLLTFLAGAEIDPSSLRRFALPSLVIGGVGFVAPFAGAWARATSSLSGEFRA
jgi:Kef-type K+ transport system membrane component KefB